MEGLDEQKPPCIFCGCFSSNKRHKTVAKLWSRHNQSLSNLSLRCRQVIKLLPCGCKATMKQSTSCQQERHQHINIFLEGIFRSIFTQFKKKKIGRRLSLRGGCFRSWAWKKEEKAPWKRKLAEGCPCAEVVLDQLVEDSLCNTGPRSHQHVLQKQNQWERIYCHQYLLKKPYV